MLTNHSENMEEALPEVKREESTLKRGRQSFEFVLLWREDGIASRECKRELTLDQVGGSIHHYRKNYDISLFKF